MPIATFTGLWFWRFRPGRRGGSRPAAPRTEAELAESVIGVRARLDDLQQQITELGRDWDERDRQLADRISGLIDIAARAADAGPHAAGTASEPGADGENKRGGA